MTGHYNEQRGYENISNAKLRQQSLTRPIIKETIEGDNRYVLSFSSAQLASPLPNPFLT